MIVTIIVGVAAFCIVAKCVTKCICKVKKADGGKSKSKRKPKKKTK